MTIARIYILHAAESAELEATLHSIADFVTPIEGCEGVEILRDMGNEKRFILIEKWASEDNHKAALAALPKAVLDRLIASLDGPLDGSYFDYL